MGSQAAARWRDQLAAWAIPDAIVAAAPEPPYGFDVRTFAESADQALARDRPTASTRRARAALPPGGSVLDVGCGAGAAALPLARRAGLLVGVDLDEGMLAEFERRARRLGVDCGTVAGRWPDVAPAVAAADVVCCHHVLYNVGDLVPFVQALTDHARRRVVVELHDTHPMSWTAPYWRALHGLERPDGPTAADAVEALAELGLAVDVDRWESPFLLADADEDATVAFLRRRLCLAPRQDPTIRALLAAHPPPSLRPVLTLSWPGKGPQMRSGLGESGGTVPH